MPYHTRNERQELDRHADEIVKIILNKYNNSSKIASALTYVISRIIWHCCGYNNSGQLSYGRMTLIFGVLEIIKSEFDRRIWTPYIRRKLTMEGDIGYESVKLPDKI